MQIEINAIRRAFGAIALSGAIALAAGCHSNSASATGPDPAQANLAPVNGQAQVLGQNASYTPEQQGQSYPQQQGYPQQAPAPVEQAYPQQAYPQQPGYEPTPEEQAGEEALEETTQAPPELPEYDQPPAPGPGYIWTPGYWAWGPGGYYWVPGAWVEAPYYGALWTPPYWGWYGGRYRFHHGYWGRHVGYYGGIDYGFGYIGIGYFGGYWSGNNFYYNRAVTRVGGGIRTVYERPVVYNNVRYGDRPVNRVSYNGGRGGINVQPRPAEIAAMRERHDAPMTVQRQARVEASQNRGQTFAANHGRPSEAFASHGFANTRGIAAAPRGVEVTRPGPEGRPAEPNVNGRIANAPHGQPYANEPRGENRAQPQPNGANPRFENRAQPQPQPRVEAPRGDNRSMQPQPNSAQPPRFENHSQPQPNAANPRFENRAQPQPQPRAEAPRMENRAVQPQPNAAQPRMENRPMPQPQQRMEAPRPENRPAPQQPRQQGPPPQSHGAPQPQGGSEHGGGGHQGGDHNPR
jgi:hypothetical protein